MNNVLTALFIVLVCVVTGYFEKNTLHQLGMACISWALAIYFFVMAIAIFFNVIAYGIPVAMVVAVIGGIVLFQRCRRPRNRYRL